jgi:hypothetical protein
LPKTASFRSGFERTLHLQLTKAKVPFEYETVKLPFSLERYYLPDFVLGNGVVIEAKGILDRDTRTKMVAVKKQHPHLDIRFVFMKSENRLTKAANSLTYAQWAERNGFPWADGRIPDEWLSQ